MCHRHLSWLLCCCMFATPIAALPKRAARAARTIDATALNPDCAASLVVAQALRDLVRQKDQQQFVARVTSRYSQRTLERALLAGSRDARRGAVIALGHFGDFRCSASLGLALRDRDPVVRRIAAEALRAVAFRAGSADQNAMLMRAFELLQSGEQQNQTHAVRLLTELIEQAPSFAEAYNLRAAAYYRTARYTDAIDDARRALDRNPYHYDAASTMAKCYLKLGRQAEALSAFRLAQEINPADGRIRSAILTLEQTR